MKKIVLFVSVLLLTGSLFAAAPVFEAKPAISGDATVTFGIDLGTLRTDTAGAGGYATTGITNSMSSNLTLGLVNKDSNEKGGLEGEVVYGWIKLKDFEMKVDGTLSVSKPGIEAKLFLGPIYINIRGDGAGTNKTVPGGILNDSGTNAVQDVLGLTPAAAATFSGVGTVANNGIVIGLVDASIVDVQIGVQSFEAWTANVHNDYGFWLSAALKAVPNLTAEVKAALSTKTLTASPTYANATGLLYNNGLQANPVNLGAKVGYGLTIAEGITLTPTLAYDVAFGSKDNATFTPWRGAVGVYLGLPGSTKDDFDKFGAKQDIKPGVSAQFAVAPILGTRGLADADNTDPFAMDLTVAAFDGTLIPVIDLIAVGEFFGMDKAANAQGGFGVWASADLTQLVPWAAFQYTAKGLYAADGTTLLVTGNTDLRTNWAKFQAGVDIKVITNTTITLSYVTEANTWSKGGIVTAAVKIAY